MKVAFLTLGCRVNQAESSVLEGTLKENGVIIVNIDENPDYCIVNTCSVTAKGDYNSRQVIRRAVRSGARVLVSGCYAQVSPSEVSAIPGVAEIFPNRDKLRIIERVLGQNIAPVYESHGRSRPHVKVQDGCNFSCSYCIVPYARGRSRSVGPDEVLRRVQMIEAAGYHEIVLTGIHLGAYGHDLVPGVNLENLVNRLLLETGIARIRLSSLEIQEVRDGLVELLQDKRLCRHLHLPLQSGSERILRLMRRRYSKTDFRKRIEIIGDKLPGVALGTDLITGFPGEGEGDVQETLSFVRDLPLSYLHVFPFSPRAGTPAAEMADRPMPSVVKERLSALQELDRQKRRDYRSRQLGRVLDAIVERSDETSSCGTTGNYLKVAVPGRSLAKGSLIFVKPTRIVRDLVEAVVVEKP